MNNRTFHAGLAALTLLAGCVPVVTPAPAPAPPAASSSAPSSTSPESDPSAENVAPAGPADRAKAALDALVAKDYPKVSADFDEAMRAALPGDKLKSTWEGILLEAGDFVSAGEPRTEKVKDGAQEFDVVTIPCEFKKAPLDGRFVFNAQGQLAGFSFRPAKVVLAGKAEIYEGTLVAGPAKLRIVLHLGKSVDMKDVATMDSPDQGAKGIPCDVVQRDGRKLHIEIKHLTVVIDGEVSEDGQSIESQFQQGGQTIPIKFQKVDAPSQVRRPQTPQPPFPYNQRNVEYNNAKGGIKLAGTLTWPKEAGRYPAVLLITGSGAQDRDETLFEHKPFLVLADYLTRRGIAVLRVDDRGVGGSTGMLSGSTTADFADDVLAGVEFLKTQPEIDPKQIGLMGHSEGGIIAPLVASRSEDVAFIVLLAGTSFTGEEILYQQGAALLRAEGVPDEVVAAHRELQGQLIAVVREGLGDDETRKKLASTIEAFQNGLDAGLKEKFAALAQGSTAGVDNFLSPWFRYFLTYDPRPALSAVKCPVLAINGEKDTQVLAKENLGGIREVLEQANHQDFHIVELPGLNHLLQTCQTGALSEYGAIEETIAPAALEAISEWLEGHVSKGREPSE